jgi:hypothetical protein
VSWLTFILGMTKALAWPTVIGIVLWSLRSQIPKIGEFLKGQVASRETEVSALGATAKLGAIVQQAEEDVQEAIAEAAEIPQGEDAERQQRERIEEVMRTAAAWGYAMAQVGFRSAPVPVIEWDGDSPKILFARGSFSSFLAGHEEPSTSGPVIGQIPSA